MSKIKNAVNYVSNEPELENWIKDFSSHLHADPHKNMVIYPESFAKGFAKVYFIEEGLTYRIVDYKLNTDFIFSTEASDKFFLIIYFYQYQNCKNLSVFINNKLIVNSNEENYSSLLMTNSLASQSLTLSEGTYVKGLTIQITEEWLQEKIAHPDTANYALFREKDVFQSFLNPKTQKLLSEIFDEDHSSSMPGLYLNNRVLRLLEAFLENILKNGLSGNSFPTNARDVQNILKVENFLIENFASEFPSIDTLARMACMSASKLKSVFKNAFGMGLYEYYQKNRMHKAKELLGSGLYSVSEVGDMISYANLSNFSSAFKKEFNYLPKDFDKIG